MTLPDERTRAVQQVGSLVADLVRCRPSERQELLEALRRAFRHYPTDFDLTQAATLAPDVFGKPKE